MAVTVSSSHLVLSCLFIFFYFFHFPPELIPEFFYLPDFLLNRNGLDLGTKQDQHKLGDVVLPPWANGSGGTRSFTWNSQPGS